MSQILGAVLLAVFTAAYFLVTYYLLKRGWIARAGLSMLAVAFIGLILVAASGDSPGGGFLFFVSLPLPLILVATGVAMQIFDFFRQRDTS